MSRRTTIAAQLAQITATRQGLDERVRGLRRRAADGRACGRDRVGRQEASRGRGRWAGRARVQMWQRLRDDQDYLLVLVELLHYAIHIDHFHQWASLLPPSLQLLAIFQAFFIPDFWFSKAFFINQLIPNVGKN